MTANNLACLFVLSFALLESVTARAAQAAPEALPTGMSMTPLAAPGSTLDRLNPDVKDHPDYTVDHPITTAISPDGGTLLIVTSGFNRVQDAKGKAIPALSTEFVFVYDVHGQKPVKKQALAIPNAYAGLAWAPDGKRFYVSGGNSDNVHVYEQENGAWKESSPAIALGHKAGLGAPYLHDGVLAYIAPAAAGVAVNASGTRLLVANYQNDSVSLVDVESRKVIVDLDLRPGINDPKQKGVPGGEYPYWTAFKGDDKAYVSSQRDREIVVLDLHAAPAVTKRIKLHGQPGRMLLNKAQNLLFAVADNSDSLVIVDTSSDRVVAEIKTTAPAAVFPNHKGFKGSIPTGLALSPDEKTIYATNAGTNSVAVIKLDRDPDDSRVAGLIPTGWYPNSVSVSADGSTLYVVNGKSNAGPNPHGCRNNFSITPGESTCTAAAEYILQLEKGGLGVIPRPSDGDLQSLTTQVARNNHFAGPPIAPNDLLTFLRLRQAIKHVIYIVKENRTYDQVLGDLEKGNGDPKLNLFPDAMTPNHHELARRFVTLDNFLDSGEVSGNGWNWSTAARATDVTDRTIPMNYARRGMTYDVEGVNRGINVGESSLADRNAAKLNDPENQLPGHGDVAAPDGPGEDESGGGYLWDSALRAKISIRNYGFYIDLTRYSDSPATGKALPLEHNPAAHHLRVAFPTRVSLQDVTDPYFRSFDQKYADYWRYKEWEREFDDYAKHDNLPALEFLRLCHDHFGDFKGAADRVNTVETEMADNDYSIGLVAEKIAHSRYAKDTLIFILEDDAQNGPDHVDAHRSIAYVIGPYVKQGAVVSERYNTVSMLRTIEEVLGLSPMGLNDSVVPPMVEVFDPHQTAWTYEARVPAVLRQTKLPLPKAKKSAKAAQLSPPLPARDADYWAGKTSGFDFSAEDKLDSSAFNLVLWNGLKGESQPYPTERDGRDLSQDREKLLRETVPQRSEP
jgi:DNA-binding beta-propeller fold protein YncE